MRKIMIVEDDVLIRQELETLLTAHGYTVTVVTDFAQTAAKVRQEQPQLILLDVMLPNENGFALCAQIRTFSQAPIIFVTASDTPSDELNSILLGGDAFITKPYHTAILLAKIDSLLKRAYPLTPTENLSWRGAVLHLERSTLEYDSKEADLTKTELKILYYLFQHAGQICPRADLVDYLWDNQLYVDDNALSVNINRIRDKLSAIGLTDLIKTKHRQGYTL